MGRRLDEQRVDVQEAAQPGRRRGRAAFDVLGELDARDHQHRRGRPFDGDAVVIRKHDEVVPARCVPADDLGGGRGAVTRVARVQVELPLEESRNPRDDRDQSEPGDHAVTTNQSSTRLPRRLPREQSGGRLVSPLCETRSGWGAATALLAASGSAGPRPPKGSGASAPISPSAGRSCTASPARTVSSSTRGGRARVAGRRTDRPRSRSASAPTPPRPSTTSASRSRA